MTNPPAGRPGAVIFDLDGLMLDTEPIYARAWTRACREQGFALDAVIASRLTGRNNRDCEAVLVQAFGDAFSLPVFRARWQALWREEVERDGIPHKPGLLELLDALEREGVPAGVATSSDREFAELTLRRAGIAGRFACVVTGDEIDRGKPAPDIFLACAERLGVPPGRCVVLEDTNAGVAAGHAAGIPTIMIPDTEAASAASAARARAVLPSLVEARRLILESG